MRTASPTVVLSSLLALSLAAGCDDAPPTSPPSAAEKPAPAKPSPDQPKEPPAEADVKPPSKAEPDTKPETNEEPPPAAVAEGMAKLALPELGLHAVAPTGTTVGPAAIEGGTLVRASDFVAIVIPAADPRPATAEAATKHRALRSRRNVKTETLDDGWVVTFQEANEWGPVYFAQVRRELAGKAVWCESASGGPRVQAETVEFCSSLTP
ncbi:MAG: hypothetical protein AAF799_38345 [Myxococcota bacterium]